LDSRSSKEHAALTLFLCRARLFLPPGPKRAASPASAPPDAGFLLRSDDRSRRLVSAGWLSNACETATILRPNHVAPPRRTAILAGALRLRATTRTVAPTNAAVARKSTRRTAGTSSSRMSRMVYPRAADRAHHDGGNGRLPQFVGILSARYGEGELRHLAESCHKQKCMVFISEWSDHARAFGRQMKNGGPEPVPATWRANGAPGRRKSGIFYSNRP
jgi:hypothetical protein